jgi:hypothetical protein
MSVNRTGGGYQDAAASAAAAKARAEALTELKITSQEEKKGRDIAESAI